MLSNKKSAERRKRPARNYQPLTEQEIDILYKKRFIDEIELLRFLRISVSTMYKLIRRKILKPSWLGSKKMFDLEELYHYLEESKRRGRVR